MVGDTVTAIRTRNLSHHYKSVPALIDITLDVSAGEMIGLLGPDGVGKSTLLGLIAGARKLQVGTLSVLGGDMASARHRDSVGPRIAYMPQGLGKNLYHDLSISENLNFFGKLFGQDRTERMRRIAQLTQATGLHPFLGRPVAKLSGGMKQKLGLCCALIHDPDLLILDEPTTGVDPLSRRQFWELIDTIRAQRAGMSVLVSTAYMDEAERFDTLITMYAGCVLATGTPAELKQKTGTADIEAAFVQLLPEASRGSKKILNISPRGQTDEAPAIVARGLTRRFGDFTAVDHVSFEIERGEIFGFLGSNGCGKTTTMKMLTGLLPASEGEAFLFGKPVDANDIESRRRVGFMSQSFSLYSELTVHQNLDLHARLFHLPRDKASERIKTLTQRFDLREHANTLASALPLGIRQRLSLAVAVIHEPELLILDEPTSGVDPVARDSFWELLIELSRKDKVTIFISTHFMNEALRCDRISLMHAGQVLVCNEPKRLAQDQGNGSLEEAFIKYIANAIGEEKETTQSLMPSGTGAPSAGHSQAQNTRFGFSVSRALAYSSRETMEVMRDPVRLAFAFLGSVVLLILMSYGISQDIENLNFAAYDQDQTPQSRAYLRNFSGSRYFVERPEITSSVELERRMKSNELTLAIEIPSGFGRALKRGDLAEVSAWIDGANATRVGTIEGYVSGAHKQFLTTLVDQAGGEPALYENVRLEPRYRYNPTFESINAMGPSIPALLLLLIPTILMAVSVAREKEIGTITNFYVTPTRRLEFLIGKQLPYVAIAMMNFLILCSIVVMVMEVPLKGSFLTLAVGTLLYVSASTGFGLLISMATKSQVAAVFGGTIVCMMPTMIFSGMLQPVSTLEGGARVIGTLWPTTYYMHLSVGAFTKGLGLGDLGLDLIALALFIPVFLLLSMLLLRKQEA